MDTHHLSARLQQAIVPSRITGGVIVALALLSAACADTRPAAITSPASFSTARDAAPAATSNFAVLGNAAVTCTNGTITGNVGTFLAAPTGSVTQTICPVTGTVHVGDAAAVEAYNAFLATYAALAPAPGDVCTTLTGTLSGVTLAPGVYCFDAAATLTGVLTLRGPANGTWVFKIGTSGTGALTGTNFSVVMAGGAQPCNVTWWVAEATTMTTSNFQGNLLSGAAITLTGGTFTGNVWSQAGVTITGTAVTGCEGVNGGNDHGNGKGNDKSKCNQGVGNGSEGCDPGNSNHHNGSNDEHGGTPGNPGRKGNG
ncbi:MAG: ice-binding family protein [Gemmatimonadaceae bacterium]